MPETDFFNRICNKKLPVKPYVPQLLSTEYQSWGMYFEKYSSMCTRLSQDICMVYVGKCHFTLFCKVKLVSSHFESFCIFRSYLPYSHVFQGKNGEVFSHSLYWVLQRLLSMICSSATYSTFLQCKLFAGTTKSDLIHYSQLLFDRESVAWVGTNPSLPTSSPEVAITFYWQPTTLPYSFLNFPLHSSAQFTTTAI